jgi:hypothetical protein
MRKIFGFEVLTVVDMNAAIFLNIAPCSLYVNRRFGGTYHLNHLPHLGFLLGRFSILKRGMICFFPKRQFTYGLHGPISHNMATFKEESTIRSENCSRE